MEIRLLLDHRSDLVAERTRTINRLRWHLVTLCPELEASLKRNALKCARARSRRPLPTEAARRRADQDRPRADRASTRAEPADRGAAPRAGGTRLRAPPQAAGRAGLRCADRRDPDRPHRWQRAVSLGGELREADGHRADPLLVGKAHPAQAQPRRRPPAQPRAAHHRDHPRPTRSRHQGIPRAQRDRGEDHQGCAAQSQALPRPPLPPAARRATRQPIDSHRRPANHRASPGGRARAAAPDPTATPATPAGQPEYQGPGTLPDGLHRLVRPRPINPGPIYGPLSPAMSVTATIGCPKSARSAPVTTRRDPTIRSQPL